MDGDAEGIVVVIPAYKEALTIGSVVLECMRYAEHVIVIDDGSPDRTSDIARRAGAEVITLPENHGKAYALRVGFDRASEMSPKACVMIDADGQHDPDDIPILSAPVIGNVADLVIGSRFIGRESEIPGYRRFGQRVLNGATNLACEGDITDSQSGYRALGPRALANMDFPSDGYSIESDMLHHFSNIGLKVCETPIEVDYNVPNKHKKNPISHGISVLSGIVRLVSQSRPLLLLGVPGLLLFALGSILGILSISSIYLFSWGWVLQSGIAMLMFIIGLVFIVGALILNSLSDLARRAMLDGAQ